MRVCVNQDLKKSVLKAFLDGVCSLEPTPGAPFPVCRTCTLQIRRVISDPLRLKPVIHNLDHSHLVVSAPLSGLLPPTFVAHVRGNVLSFRRCVGTGSDRRCRLATATLIKPLWRESRCFNELRLASCRNLTAVLCEEPPRTSAPRKLEYVHYGVITRSSAPVCPL